MLATNPEYYWNNRSFDKTNSPYRTNSFRKIYTNACVETARIINSLKSLNTVDSDGTHVFIAQTGIDDVLASDAELNKVQSSSNCQSTAKIAMFKSILNSHKLILEKILKKSNDNYSQNNMQKGTKNVKSINDLFSKYLYYLKIYSPFVSIENNTTVKQKMERVEASNVNESTKDNDVKNVLDNKNIVSQQNDNNNEEFFDEFSLFNSRNDYPFLDLNLHNNYSSKSFLSINKF